MTKSRRDAFTLVELLVVITIIGMLMAIIVPAVSAVKEIARQTTCVNNQIEIAKAMLSFESRKGRFPGFCEKYKPANRDGNNNNNNELVYAWTIAILPELQRNDLFTAFTSDDPREREDMREERIHLAMYVCPSGQKDRSYDTLSYVVNSGRRDSGGNQGKDKDISANGVFHNRNRNVRNPVIVSTSTITRADGVSNTLMLSENLSLGDDDRWAWIYEGGNKVIDERQVSFLWLPRVEPGPSDRINGEKERNVNRLVPRPSSNHSGGVVVAFCNGTAKFIAEDIDYKVYWQLMTPDGRHATADSGQIPEGLWRYKLNEQDY